MPGLHEPLLPPPAGLGSSQRPGSCLLSGGRDSARGPGPWALSPRHRAVSRPIGASAPSSGSGAAVTGTVSCSAAAETGTGVTQPPGLGRPSGPGGHDARSGRSVLHTVLCAHRPMCSALVRPPPHRLSVGTGSGHGAAAGSPPPLPGRAVLVQSPRLPPASLDCPQRRREGARPCDRLSRPPGPTMCRQTRGPGPPQDAQEGLVLWASLWARAWPVGRGAWPSLRPLELQHPPHVWPRLTRWLFLLATCHFSNTLLSRAVALADTDSLDLHSNPSGRSC